MPYLGNQHNVGDHVNNFKVLDDISSHTATFDGSATSVVSAADDTIRIPEHRFIQGQRVTYTNGGGGNIGGLTTGTAYFVSFDSANTIKLATTLANANSNTVINLSAVGSGTSHTLNAAFDGVNTKFKMTYGSGKAARLNNATQINVAINNVIQRPNVSALSFTEGFALEDNHKIVFKTAPTSNDIFWGSIIANTIENFDLRDNEVDNFTGDGTTTEFTLSTIPANNESVIVSINGVVQHPSDKNTARSYTLIDSIIEFTAAPALGDEIQVRHIGFAGASTNDVSGFYGRTGNVALTSSDHITTGDITSRNINSSGVITATTFDGAFSSGVGGSNANFTGIVTAGVFKGGDIEGRNLKITGLSTFVGDASFSGNVSIGGTLTYEDVTNIDSVGIITARLGIQIPNDTYKLRAGTNLEMQVFHNGTNSIIKDTRDNGKVRIQADNFDIRDKDDSKTLIAAGADSSVSLSHSGNQRIQTTSTGANVTGTVVATGADINGDIDVDGHTNLDNVSISGVTTITGALFANGFGTNGGEIGLTGTIPRINFTDSNANSDFRIKVDGGSFQIEDITNSSADRFTINSSGNVSINKDLDVDGHTNLDNVSIAGVTTATTINATTFVGALTGTASGNPTLTSGANNRVVTATGANAITGESNLTFTGSILTVTNSSGPSELTLVTPSNTDGGVYFNDGSNTGALTYQHSDDSMRFRVDSLEKLRIDSSGNLFLRGASANYLVMGSSGDATSGGVTNNMNWIRGNQTNTQYNTAGGFHSFEVSGSEKLRITSAGKISYNYDGSAVSSVADVDIRTNNGIHIRGQDANSNNTNIYIGGAVGNQRKTAIIHDPVGGYCRGDLHFCLENSADLSDVDVTDSQMVIKANGRVGINTDNPQTTLYSMNEIAAGDGNRQFIGMQTKVVNGAPVGEIRTTYYSGASGTYPHMRFVTSDNERVRITSGGMVLIGETSVAGGSQKLVIGQGGAENFEFTPGSSTYNGGVLEYIHRGDGSTRPDLSMYVAGGAFKVYTNGANERLRIASNGQITTRGASGTSFNNAGNGDFGSFLTINGGHTSNQWGILSLEGNTTSNGYPVGQIQFINQDNANGSSGSSVQSRMVARIDSIISTSDSNASDDSGGHLRFFTKQEGVVPTEKLRITGTGSFGFNTYTIRENIHTHQTDSNQNYLRFTNTGTGTGSSDGFNIGINASEEPIVWNFENTDMFFATNNIEKLIIESGQNGRIKARDNFDNFVPLQNVNGHIKHPNHTTSNKTNLSVGWYTIAVNDGSRASARFNLIDRAGSRHQSFTFYASHHYGGATPQNAINVIHGGGRHSSNPIQALRILANGTYDGAMLQVYIAQTSNVVMASIDGSNMNTNGWVMKDWIAHGTNPGGLNNWSSINSNGGEAAYANLTQINAGGMSCDGNFIPGFDNSGSHLGTSARRWVRVYAGDSSINTSDENLKQNITTLTTAEMNAAKRLSKLFVTYKWKKSVSEKGEKARTHTGIIAQRVKAEMIAAGLDPTQYSFYCEDDKYTMPDGTEVDLVDQNLANYEVVPDNYVPSLVQPPGSTKSTIYSICYTELLAFIAAYNEQRFTSIETRLAALEGS